MPADGDRALSLTVAGTGRTINIRPRHLVIAGFTGRDETSVADHVRELAAIGVPVPAVVPAFWKLDAALLTADRLIEVPGPDTSGEAEPVIIRHDGRLYLGVGSDHTDRELERYDIPGSKAACPKPLSREVAGLPDRLADRDWDQIELSCTVDGADYQHGTLAELRPPADLLTRLQAAYGPECDDGDLVMFCGTLPLLHGRFVAGTSWDLSLRVPGQAPLQHQYQVRRRTDPTTGVA
jgi:Protein of unknown function (DUF2848)